MRTKIYVEPKEKKELMMRFDCSLATVHAALAGKTKTYLAEHIREAAIKDLGGVERVVINPNTENK